MHACEAYKIAYSTVHHLHVCVCIDNVWANLGSRVSVRGGDVTAGGRLRLAVAEPIANDVQWVELLVFRLSRPIF